MTKSENFILKGQVITMSLFRLTLLKAYWLVIMLAVVAADDAYVQETIGKEERPHFKNATLQLHYGRTAGVSSSNYCDLCFCVYWCCNKFHSEPLETCQVPECYVYHTGWHMNSSRWIVSTLVARYDRMCSLTSCHCSWFYMWICTVHDVCWWRGCTCYLLTTLSLVVTICTTCSNNYRFRFMST